jgi:enamine deaminase RidA (YjgF/YER057c/UK114 family)
MSLKFINPAELGPPKGYSNGVITDPGARLLFIAGQVGWNERQEIISTDFVEQFDRALASVVAVVTEAGGRPEQIARMVLYVTDKNEYQLRTDEIGERYRAHMGKHFPAMALVEVKGLLDDAAKIEIEAIATLSPE